ncbi:putative periplasmic lipoprotein [Jeotgalibaca ciconiae]|uniref:Lipoprotein n=1 Tax=Jeotgalibaca ciconiae TaxID=2496265 RepID=A0A3Q9BMK1_9LACT|nr:hypothetical protein [Jeotgalibaca ciconiae]AZP04765.1 hypothetical protein EJN90_09020 [Jeotgalibaca ciconiae]
MKKLSLLFIASFTLAACAAENNSDSSEAVESMETIESEVSSAPESVETSEHSSQESETASEDLEGVTEEELANAESVSEYDSYEELVYQDVFNPEQYQGSIVTDNQGKRIFLFSDGQNQIYKTIYIKHDNRLKIIDLQKDDLVYNKIIQ